MKKLLLLLVILSCFKLSFSQSNENIWKMPKDTSRFGKVILKEQIVTFVDSTITGSNILYRCYKTFTANQSVRDVINSGVYKVVGGSGGGSGEVPTLQQVTDVGNTTDKDIYIDKLYLKDYDEENNAQLRVESGKLYLKGNYQNIDIFNIGAGSFNLKNFSDTGYSIFQTNLAKSDRHYTFQNKDDTIAGLSDVRTKLSITDTGTMLSPYLRKLDTLSLSNRINTKLNKSDTLSLSSRIDLKLNKTDTLSLSNRINTKLNASDTNSLSNRINDKLSLSSSYLLRPFSIHETYDSLLNKPTINLQYVSGIGATTTNAITINKYLDVTNADNLGYAIKARSNNWGSTALDLAVLKGSSKGINIGSIGDTLYGMVMQMTTNQSKGIYIGMTGKGNIPLQITNSGSDTLALFQKIGVNSQVFKGNGSIITPLLYNSLITDGKTITTKDYVDTLQIVRDTLLHDPTGFTNNDNINVSYDSTTRKFTLTGTYQVYKNGRVINVFSSPYTSPAHDSIVNKTFFLHYNNNGIVFDTIPWIFDEIQVAAVYYGVNDKIGYAETHGLMAWQTHQSLHNSVGTTFTSGGDISGITLNNTTSTVKRPNISATTINDEDFNVIDSAITNKQYTLRYLTGATGGRNYLKSQTDIIPLLANRPYYNQFTGGTWQQTLFNNNDYGAIFIVAIPATKDGGSQLYRYQFVQPQQVSQTLANIQLLTPSNINAGETFGAEFVFIGKIIIRYVGGGTNNWSIIQVDKLTGNRFNQQSTTSGYLSTVATDASLTGNGTAASPLSVVKSVWADIPDAPTRATSTTFTITGDYSSYIAKGLVIKWTESSTIRCAMVSIPSTFSSPNTTVTFIGDTIVAAGFDASSVKYYLGEVSTANFAVAGVIGAVDTAVSNTFCAMMPYRVFGADIWNYKSGSTNNTTADVNKNISLSNAGSLFTIKPTLATTVGSSPTPFTATTYTSLVLGDKVFMDIDAIQTVPCTDLFLRLYILPTRILYLN